MIQIEKIWLFETEVLDPYYFGTVDGVEVFMKDERTVSLLSLDNVAYFLNGVTKSGFSWSSKYGGEDRGVLTTLGKQEYEYELSFDLPLYSGRIVDEMTGRLFSFICEKRNGQRFVVFGQFYSNSFDIDNEQQNRLTLKTDLTNAQMYNVESLNIGNIADSIDCSQVFANLDKFNRMNYDFFPTTNIPSEYRIIDMSSNSITVAWTKALGANGYEIRWGFDPNVLDQVITINGGEVEQYTIEGLPPSTTIWTKIKSKGQFVDSLFSPVISGSTEESLPEQPTGLALNVVSDTEIDASWNLQIDADSYVIEWDTVNTFDSPDFDSDTSLIFAYQITGLDPETEYFVRVKAVNTAGESPYSDVESATTEETPLPVFSFTVQSDNTGTSGNDEFTFPQRSGTSPNYTISSPDSSATPVVVTADTDPTTIVFPEGAGTYTIEIVGDDIQPFFNNGGDRQKVLDVLNWGGCTIGLGSFNGCSNSTFATATDIPILSTNIQNCFLQCTAAVFNSSIENWDMSQVSVPESMFRQCPNFNAPVNWIDTSSFTDMQDIFNGATAFDQPVSNWNTSNATVMTALFGNLPNFNQPLTNFDTSNVTFFGFFLFNATSFNQDISNFSFVSALSLSNMLTNCGMSSSNYNLLLAKLRTDAEGAGITTGMTLGANGLVATGQGITDRTWLINNTAMTIIDATPASINDFGVIYSESNLVAGDYSITGGGFTFNAGDIDISGGASNFANYALLEPTTPFIGEVHNFERWTQRIKVEVNDNLSTGVGVGAQSINSYEDWDNLCRFAFNTSNYYMYKELSFAGQLDGGSFAPVNGTSYWFELERDQDTYTCRVFDSTNTTELSSHTFAIASGYGSASWVFPNTGRWSLFNFGGTHTVQEVEIELPNDGYCARGKKATWVGDSNTLGFLSSKSDRYIDRVLAGQTTGDTASDYLVLAGNSDRVEEVELLRPIIQDAQNDYIFVCIGTNNRAEGDSAATLKTKWDALLDGIRADNPSSQVVIISPIAGSADMTQVDIDQAAYAATHSLEFVSGFQATKGVGTGIDPAYAANSWHINAAGHQEVANEILNLSMF